MVKTEQFDAAKYLTDPHDQAELINDALQSGDPIVIATALGIVARARPRRGLMPARE